MHSSLRCRTAVTIATNANFLWACFPRTFAGGSTVAFLRLRLRGSRLRFSPLNCAQTIAAKRIVQKQEPCEVSRGHRQVEVWSYHVGHEPSLPRLIALCPVTAGSARFLPCSRYAEMYAFGRAVGGETATTGWRRPLLRSSIKADGRRREYGPRISPATQSPGSLTERRLAGRQATMEKAKTQQETKMAVKGGQRRGVDHP
ncbi:hypothetical protein MRX96_056464 [Rhipicephalus microplus]